MARLPIPGDDKGTWGTILNDYLSQSLDSGGLLIPASVVTAGAEMTTNKNQPSGYAGLDSSSNLSITGRVMQVGPVHYPYTASLSGGGANSAYALIDKSNTASDSSLLFRDQGAIRTEIGLAGDNNIHFKTVTGASGSEVFTDRIIIQTSGEVEVVNSLGVGTIPVTPLHVTSSTTGGARTIAKIENTNGSGSAAGSLLEFKGATTDWLVGTDAGLNGGNNFFIEDGIAGYPPRVLIDSSGNMAIGSDSPGYKLDVRGDIAVNTVGSGFKVKEGSNAKMGVATLSAGSVTVSTTAVASTSRIMLTTQSPSGTVGTPYIFSRSAGTSFVIHSTSGTDASTVAWVILDPA
jgi:hypothetical protein